MSELEHYIRLGVQREKVFVSVHPSVCTWSLTRECLVGDRIGGPLKPELISLGNGNFKLSYENNRMVSMLNHSKINVDEINNSPGIIIPEDTNEYFRFAYVPLD